MFQAWLKRSALKQKTGRRSLLISAATGPNRILLLGLLGIFIALGVFVISTSYAAGYFGH